MREIKRSERWNALGSTFLDRLEASPRQQAWREALWRVRAYLVVTPGPELIRRALEGFPAEVRELCATAPLYRFDARGGGGFYPDKNEIWLAAGVETYEGRAQVPLSSRHELFHFVCWNHPRYRDDESTGFPRFRAAIEKGHAELDGYPRYRDWYRRSFLPQGDHANIVELFADIPTNFRDLREIPPALAEHFEPLIGS